MIKETNIANREENFTQKVVIKNLCSMPQDPKVLRRQK